MSDVDFDLILLIAVAVIILFAIYRYRSKIAIRMKAWGVNLDIKGENREPSKPKTTVPEPASADAPNQKSVSAKGNVADASGDGAVAIGGDAPGATISTSSNKPDSKST